MNFYKLILFNVLLLTVGNISATEKAKIEFLGINELQYFICEKTQCIATAAIYYKERDKKEEFLRLEHFFWNDDILGNLALLNANVWEDKNGKQILNRIFKYDSENGLVKENRFDEETNKYLLVRQILELYDSDDNLSIRQIDDQENHTTLEKKYFYDSYRRLALLEDEQQQQEEFVYDVHNQLIQSRLILSEGITGIKKYSYNENRQISGILCLFSNGKGYRIALTYLNKEDKRPMEQPIPSYNHAPYQYIWTIKDKWMQLTDSLSYANYAANGWESALSTIFGSTFLKMIGYYNYEAETGASHIGEELYEKIRITSINGILNSRDDLQVSLHQLSDAHGHSIIHYIYRPTGGWMSDIVSCCMTKLGFVSSEARLLARKWKELIKEMGGIHSDGIILHYAHSIGAIDTYAAKKFLLPQEQKKIYVITIGSPSMIPNEGFLNVTNYVSKRDGICLLDPIGLLKGSLTKKKNVVFLGSLWGLPFVEHTLDSQAYSELIKVLGKDFLEKYTQPI